MIQRQPRATRTYTLLPYTTRFRSHRRIRIGLDFHEVQAFVLGQRQRLVARQHADHLAVAADHAYARNADFLVLAVLLAVGGADMAVLGLWAADRGSALQGLAA